MTIPAVPAAQAQPRKLGCWFYGCTSLFVLFVLGAVGLYFGAKFAANKLRDSYTSAQPLSLERVELPPAEWTNLQERILAFGQALEQGQAQELVLSEREVNAYLDNHPKHKETGERVHITIRDDQIGGQVSWPIPDVGVFKMAGVGGRYLNGKADFEVTLEEGQLLVFMQDMMVNEKPLPEDFNKEFRKNNLAQEMQKDAETRAALQKFESIRITNGQVVLRSKSSSPGEEN